MRHILYITGTRADYGLMRNTLTEIVNTPGLKLSVVVTGMHLLDEFGNTYSEILSDSKKYGFGIIKCTSTYDNDTRESMSRFIGEFTSELTKICAKIKPDVILLLGDRGEMLAGAIVGIHLGIPIAHIHGGDVSSTVDDITRHAITKMSNIHFAASQSSADRIIKLGEDKSRVFVVGAPGLDRITEDVYDERYIREKYGLNTDEKYFILIQHPVSAEIENAEKHIEETLKAIIKYGAKHGTKTIVVYPNSDAGGRKIIDVLEKYRNNQLIKNPLIKFYKSLNRKDFLSLLKYSSGLIGNSSSGIIEAASFRKPVINIGTRQLGRERGLNVIDARYSCDDIYAAMKKISEDKKFLNSLKKIVNPYSKGNAGKAIADILSRIELTKDLTQKRLTY